MGQTSLEFRFQLARRTFLSAEELQASAIDLFDVNDDEESIDGRGEIAAIDWIMREPDTRDFLLGALGFEGRTFASSNVTRPFLKREGGGDIDLLVAQNAAHAHAIQAKRFKVTIEDAAQTVTLSTTKMEKLVRQVNETAQLGFHAVYGLVLVMIDARNHAARNLVHRGVDSMTFRRIYRFVREAPLHSRAGLIFLELVQPTGADFTELSRLAVAVDKAPSRIEQSGDFSELVAKWMDGAEKRSDLIEIPRLPSNTRALPIGADQELGVRLTRRPTTDA